MARKFDANKAYEKYASDCTVLKSGCFHVRSYADALALTVHNLSTNTSVGIVGAEARAVLNYADALREYHPTASLDSIWSAVWRDFDMDHDAKPFERTEICYV